MCKTFGNKVGWLRVAVVFRSVVEENLAENRSAIYFLAVQSTIVVRGGPQYWSLSQYSNFSRLLPVRKLMVCAFNRAWYYIRNRTQKYPSFRCALGYTLNADDIENAKFVLLWWLNGRRWRLWKVHALSIIPIFLPRSVDGHSCQK